MKVIRYQLKIRINRGTPAQPLFEEILTPVELGWNEVNEAIAKAEAVGGEYTVEEKEVVSIASAAEQRLAAVEKTIARIPAMIVEEIKRIMTGK